MPGLPFPSMNQDTPESIIDNYLQQGMQTLREKYTLQWREVAKRGDVLGERKQREMLSEIDMKAKQEVQEFQQTVRQRAEELARVDRLAQQSGFDASEAKWRMVLSPEEIAMKFPKEQTPRSVAEQYGELDIYRNKLENRLSSFVTTPGGPIKSWRRREKNEDLTAKQTMFYDPNLNPRMNEKGELVTGDLREMTWSERQERARLIGEYANVKALQQEILSQPDVATRIRGPMLRVQRDAKNTSLATKIEEAKTPVNTGKLDGTVWTK